MNRRCVHAWAVVGVALMGCLCARAADPNAPADFGVLNVVAAPAPERFGANITGGIGINNWTNDPGMEPIVLRYKFIADGGGPDFILQNTGATTDLYRTVGDHFLDGAGVRIYRTTGSTLQLLRTGTVAFYRASGVSGHQIDLSTPGPAVQAGDVAFVELNPNDAPVEYVDERLRILEVHDSWERGDQVANTASRYKVRDATTVCPENGGRTSMKLHTDFAEPFDMRQYRYGDPGVFLEALEPGHTYRVEAWLKQTGVPGNVVTFRMTSTYAGVSHTWTNVKAEWKKFSFEFIAPAVPPPNSTVVQQIIGFTGPGTLWVDNLVVYDVARPAFSIDPRVIQEFTRFSPGPLRIWSGHENGSWGGTLEDWTNIEILAQQRWSGDEGRRAGATFKLPTALDFCRITGASPWLIVGPFFSEQEWTDLIDYLAGPTSTFYGAKRAAQGHPTPWTDEFSRVIIELGNESWNPMFQPWADLDSSRYGLFLERFIQAAKSNPNFIAVANKIVFMANGVVDGGFPTGYGFNAIAHAPSAGMTNLTAYTGGWELGGTIGGTILNDIGFQNTLMYLPARQQYLTDQQAATRDAVALAGRSVALGVYEAGPSYNLPSPAEPFNNVTEQYGKSLANAVSTLDCFLYNSYRRVGPQAFFIFRPGANWSSHTLFTNGYRPHASWLALEMRNRFALGDMLVTTPYEVPTMETAGSAQSPPDPNAPLIACYNFKQGSTYSTFILSRKLSASTLVSVRLPFTASTGCTRYSLSADPRTTNIDALNLQIQAQGVLDWGGNAGCTIPPGTIYLFVATGCTGDTRPTNPRVTISRAVGQPDNATFPEIDFTVAFDRPVTGFTASDVLFGGTSNPTDIAVTEPIPQFGTTYRVAITGMRNSGTVAITVPAAVCNDAATGAPNDAATSIDSSVNFTLTPPQNVLVAWDDLNTTPTEAPYPPFLGEVNTGQGFSAAWYVQDFFPQTYVDGFRLMNTRPLRYRNLQITGRTYAVGGLDFATAGRHLDIEGALSRFRVSGSLPAVAGLSGTTLYTSVLLRKELDNNDECWISLVDYPFPDSPENATVSFGYFGPFTNSAGVRYWGMRVHNLSGLDFDYYRTNIPVEIGRPTLLVLKAQFRVNDVLSLYVNPTTLGGPEPATPDATFTRSSAAARDITFRCFGYFPGGGLNEGSMDEIRFGDSFAAVTPIGCPADVDDGTGSGNPDGGVTIDDLLYFLFVFDAGSALGDLDDGTGSGIPDGGVTVDDLLFMLFHFDAGC